MRVQGAGQRVALVDRILDLGEDGLESAVFGLLDQSGQGWHQRDAGAEESGELAGGEMHFLLFYSPADPHGPERRGGGFGRYLGRGFPNLNGVGALAADFLPGRGL